MSDFGIQVLGESLSPLPSPCRILKFEHVADAVAFFQTINLDLTRNYKSREVGSRFLLLGTLADKRDQHEVWSANPMYGMYTVKVRGETKGEVLTMEEEMEEADQAHMEEKLQAQWQADLYLREYRPPTPPTDWDDLL